MQTINPNALRGRSEEDFERSREISQYSGVHEPLFTTIRPKDEAVSPHSANSCQIMYHHPKVIYIRKTSAHAQNPNVLHSWIEGDFERSREISQYPVVHEPQPDARTSVK